MNELIGKRFMTLVRDMEEDDDYGEVSHPVGSTFIVSSPTGEHYMVLWEQAVTADGRRLTGKECDGMWTLWTEEEIRRDAVEL